MFEITSMSLVLITVIMASLFSLLTLGVATLLSYRTYKKYKEDIAQKNEEMQTTYRLAYEAKQVVESIRAFLMYKHKQYLEIHAECREDDELGHVHDISVSVRPATQEEIDQYEITVSNAGGSTTKH